MGKSARRASLEGGLTQDAIRNILREKSKNPRRDTLEGIARGLDWDLDELLQNSYSEPVYHSKTAIQSVPIISWIDAESVLSPRQKYDFKEKTKDRFLDKSFYLPSDSFSYYQSYKHFFKF